MALPTESLDDLHPCGPWFMFMGESCADFGFFYVGNSSSSLAISNSNLAIADDSCGTEKPESKSNENDSPAVQTSKPSEPYFIVPPGFRPNTFFVGMEKYVL